MQVIAIGALKCLEVGKALTIERSDLAIQDYISDGQPGYRAHQVGEAEVKIVTALRIEANRTIAFVELAAPAVELDLVKPARAIRRTGPLRWNARFDEGEATRHTTYVYNLFYDARTGARRFEPLSAINARAQLRAFDPLRDDARARREAEVTKYLDS